MRLAIAFSSPFTRAQAVSALSDRLFGGANASLPQGVDITLAVEASTSSIGATGNADNDSVNALEVDGFASLAEVCTFLESLPTAVDTRLQQLRVYNS